MNKLEQLGQGPHFIKCVKSDLYQSILKLKLDHDFIIFGRSRDADVYVMEDNISKCHAILMKISSMWYLIDFDSLNGVFVNHQKMIAKSPYRLEEGDVFSLGPSEYISFTFGSYKREDGKRPVKFPNSYPEGHISQIAKLQEKIVQLENELQFNRNLKDETESSQMCIRELKDELQSKTDSLENHISQTVKEHNQIEDLRKVISQLEEKCEAKVQIEANLNIRIGELVRENSVFKKEMEKMKHLQQLNLAEHEVLNVEIDRHEQEACAANGEINRLNTKIEKLTIDCKIANEGLRNTELVVQENEMELRRLQNLYHDVTSRNQALSSDLSEIELRITKRNENLIRENKALIIKNKNLSCQITQLNQKVLHSSQGPGNNQGMQDMQNHVNLVMENELNCSICSDFFVNAVTLGCSHVFCLFCITSWKKKKLDCPTCRKSITMEAMSPVIDNFINKMVLYLPNEIKTQRDKSIEERAPKIAPQQQPQRNLQFKPRVQPQQPSEWRRVPSRQSTRATRSANSYNPPPRFQHQNYTEPAASNYARYDLDFF